MSSTSDSTSCNVCDLACLSSKNPTCWRGDTDSESDEQPPPAKRQRTTDLQTNSTGGAHDGGQQFEIKVAAVTGLRAMNLGDNFELSTNVKDAGNFDDLVYTTNGRRYFLQLKHTEKPEDKNLQPAELHKLLHKCFETYYNIDDKVNSVFMIYTNKRLGPKLSGHERKEIVENTVERIFKTGDEGEIFNFIRDNNQTSDVYSAVEGKVRQSKEFKDLSVAEQNEKLNMISEFLNKLIMVTGQKSHMELDKVMYKELKKRDKIKVGREVYDAVLRYLKTRIDNWWRKREGNMTPEMLRNWLQEAKTSSCLPSVKSLFKSCKEKLVKTGVKCSDSEISWLKTELSNKHAVHLRSDALTLCTIFLLDSLPTSKCIFVSSESLQSNKNMLFYAWLGGHWEWLIVCCDAKLPESDILDTCLEISENSKSHSSSKRVIILTTNSVQHITRLFPVERILKFKQLSEYSQEIVLDKTIDFQGCEVSVRSILHRHGIVEDVVGHELVTDLITQETPVNVGGKLHVSEDYYAHRVLERNIYLRLDILEDPYFRPYMYSMRKEKLTSPSEFPPTGEDVVIFVFVEDELSDVPEEGYFDIERRITIKRAKNWESAFCELSNKYSTNTLHWLEYKNGDLLWKKSRFRTDLLLGYIDAVKTHADRRVITEWMERGTCEVKEESIWDLNERTVLVVAEPGMGKSSTTTNVAWHTKQRDSTSWVLRVNWNDHTRKLQDINVENFDFNSLVEFLYSASLPDSKYTDFNMSLLKQALQNSGNITVLMDGFDEITPTHAEKAAVILSELMKTKVGKVWVTSRPVERERLEKELSVSAFSMKKLSSDSQEEMLRKLWVSKASGREYKLDNFIHGLLFNVGISVRDTHFTGSPLHIIMIATAYEKEMEMCLNSEDVIIPRIDLLKLYTRFVERKLEIYLEDKEKADRTNASVQSSHEYLKKHFIKNFEMCALLVILPSELLNALHNKEIENETKSFLRDVQDGKDNTGIVTNAVEGKPLFLHRTFAEYFTALWFSKNFELNRKVLEHILFDSNYDFVTDMFDRMLTADSPLHCAIIDGDMNRLLTLLDEGCDVNALDKGGRTAVHLVTAKNSFLLDTTFSVYYNDVSLGEPDGVLQWTPIQYATKWKNWDFVERLLESSVHKTELEIFGVKDAGYIGNIIMHAASYGHFSLLEYLRRIGVNILQASSEDFLSPLHAAVAYREVQVVKWLIQLGADCNTRYSDGQTLLLHAVTTGSFDVVRALVEEGGASVDTCDDQGRTAIDRANEYASDPKNPMNQTLIMWEYYVEGVKEILKYLRERGCKESSSVCQNNDT